MESEESRSFVGQTLQCGVGRRFGLASCNQSGDQRRTPKSVSLLDFSSGEVATQQAPQTVGQSIRR